MVVIVKEIEDLYSQMHWDIITNKEELVVFR
jgi:hypothetical protein